MENSLAMVGKRPIITTSVVPMANTLTAKAQMAIGILIWRTVKTLLFFIGTKFREAFFAPQDICQRFDVRNVTSLELDFGQSAQCFPCDPQIGSDHGLGHPLHQTRV